MLILIPTALFLNEQNKLDKLVGLSFSTNMVRVQEVTGDINRRMLENVDSKEELLSILEEGKNAIESEAISLNSYSDINSNFIVNSIAIRDFYNWIEMNVIENGKLNDSDINALNSIIELNKSYKSIARFSTYEEREFNIKKLEMPQSVTEYFDSIEVLVEEVRYTY